MCPKRRLVGVFLNCLCAFGAAGGDFEMDFERDSLPLNGGWERLPEHSMSAREALDEQQVWKPEAADALGPWTQVSVPGPLQPELDWKEQKKVRFVWMRRRFSLGEERAARSAVLKWNGIRFGATVWLNGRQAGHHAPIGPNTILIPDGVLREGDNVLLLKVPGWPAVPKGRAGYPLIPTGFGAINGGTPAIYDDIWLEFYDGAYLKNILAMPDVENQLVTFRIWMDAAGEMPGALDLRARVRLWRSEGLCGETKEQAATGKMPVEITVKLTDIKPWTPQAPHLYVAELRAESGGKACDRVRFRFGMRTIEVVEGHYQLNGKPLWLRGGNLVFQWLWGEPFASGAKLLLVDEARRENVNCFRTHTLPPSTSWTDICDEHGTMLLAEFPALYNHHDFKFTPEEQEIWNANVLLDAAGWMTKLWNHPSVIVWVLTNESPRRNEAWESGPYYDYVKSLDPTRPAMRSGSEGKAGTPEVHDIHTCRNWTSGAEGSLIRRSQWEAQKKDPKRTLGNSEYMNTLSPREKRTTRWLGRPDHPEAELNQAEFAMEHTEAMRRCQFDCILPYTGYAGSHVVRGRDWWRAEYPTPSAAALHSALAPVLASLDLFDRNFVAGSEVTTTVHLINELCEDVSAKLDIYVTPENPVFVPDADALAAAIWRESLDVEFGASTIQQRKVRWKVPEAEGIYFLAAVVTRAGDGPVVSQRTVRAIVRKPLPERLKKRGVVVLGAAPTARWTFKSVGVPIETSLQGGKVPGEVLVVWDQGRVSEGERAAAPAILDFVREGGRVVILAQDAWTWRELVDFEVSEKGNWLKGMSSRVFPCEGADHPILDGIDPEWLKRWNGLPGVIADRSIQGKVLEKGRKLLWMEDPRQTVLLSLPLGRGEIVICFLRIPRRGILSDPAAERFFVKLLGF